MARRATVRRSARFVGLVAGASAIMLTLVVPSSLEGGSSSAGAAPAPDPSSAQARVDAARGETEAIAKRYFAQLDRYEVVGSEIAAIEQRMADIRRESTGLRAIVARRALRAYKSGGSSSVDFMLDGAGITDVVRGTKLLAVANARDDDAVARLAGLSEDLTGRRAELETSRREQVAALADLRGAQTPRRRQPAVRAGRPAVGGGAARRTGRGRTWREASRRCSSGLGDHAGSGTRGTGRRLHADRWLASASRRSVPLLHARRESHGQYSAVNASGPYLGAYQFLQSTWNITAQHAGRTELVGVPPNAASAYDQDDMAWTLYQWQGTGPWGGAC